MKNPLQSGFFILHMRFRMDITLLLFIHTLMDLRLQEQEIVDILKCGSNTAADFEACIQNPAGRAYLREHPDWLEKAAQIYEKTTARGVRWCKLGDPDYPVAWLNLSTRPLIFSYRGEPVWRDFETLSVVGSRTPSGDTRLWMQRELTRFLREKRIAVVSGGARGVDQWAHRLSMDCGRPTICIFPSGILNPYPFEHHELWERILIEGGCLLSTYAPECPMRKHAFIQRNRWIAGLSKMTFVAEANRRSGSLITAKYAVDEDRALCTLPVFPHSEQGLGNLDLIVGGATMIRDSADLLTFWNNN